MRDIHDTGLTPLQLASQNGNIDMVRLLISQKATFSKISTSPLIFATQSGNLELVTYLVENKAYATYCEELIWQSSSVMNAIEKGLRKNYYGAIGRVLLEHLENTICQTSLCELTFDYLVPPQFLFWFRTCKDQENRTM